MDSFISSCQHGAHIHSCIAIDRQNKENASKYRVEQIANTVEQTLRDHPPPESLTPFKSRNNPYRRITSPASINQIDQDSESEENAASSSDCINPTILSAVIEEVKTHPQAVNNPKCIVCRIINPQDANHPFSRCPLLLNHEHCKDMYKEAMAYIKRLLNKQQNVLQLSEEEVNATIAEIRTVIQDSTQDFLQGNNEE